MAVKQVPVGNSAPLTGNESMAATNTITDESGSMAFPRSPSESTDGKDIESPAPSIPAGQVPLTPTASKMGLPSAPGQSGGGWSTGVQGGGNQGHGNPGAGSSGPDRWKPTISSS